MLCFSEGLNHRARLKTSKTEITCSSNLINSRNWQPKGLNLNELFGRPDMDANIYTTFSYYSTNTRSTSCNLKIRSLSNVWVKFWRKTIKVDGWINIQSWDWFRLFQYETLWLWYSRSLLWIEIYSFALTHGLRFKELFICFKKICFDRSSWIHTGRRKEWKFGEKDS